MKDMAVHDHSYKLLFSHAGMVRDLLEGFIGGEWLAGADFSTLERVSDAYVTDDLRARADDIIWRVRCGRHYVYLLLEFQSSDEPCMAVRVLTYVGLLYQDLIKAKTYSASGPLPNVLPVVIYNGTSRWRAANEITSLLYESPRDLEQYRPAHRYLLIDEGAYDDAHLARDDNLVAMLFRLENCFERDQVTELVRALVRQLNGAEYGSLRRAFAIWLDRVVFERFAEDDAHFSNQLWESETMLADRVPIWEEELRQEGREQGRQQGEASLLLRQLQKRFGELPDSVGMRVNGSTCEQLGLWAERLLDCRSLNDLFEAEVAS
jgi:hypothetical protein